MFHVLRFNLLLITIFGSVNNKELWNHVKKLLAKGAVLVPHLDECFGGTNEGSSDLWQGHFHLAGYLGSSALDEHSDA